MAEQTMTGRCSKSRWNSINHYVMGNKIFVLLWMMVIQASSLIAQNAVAELHFENAEKAYNSGKYREVISKLDDTERLVGPTAKTFYLRIITEEKLFNGGKNYASDDFVRLSNLRENVAIYLEVMAEHGLDDRYREIYRISEDLKKYPKTAEEWKENRDREVRLKEEREEQARAQSTLREKLAREKEREDFMDGKITINRVRNNLVAKYAPSAAVTDAAVVYIIRPGKLANFLVPFEHHLNDLEIVKLKNKQHAVRKFTPGLFQVVQRFADKESNRIILDLQPGKTYYIRSISKVSAVSELELLTEEEAQKDIENTQLQNE